MLSSTVERSYRDRTRFSSLRQHRLPPSARFCGTFKHQPSHSQHVAHPRAGWRPHPFCYNKQTSSERIANQVDCAYTDGLRGVTLFHDNLRRCIR